MRTILLLVCCARFLIGQDVTGTITGAVVDSSGAAIPNASVKVIGTDLGLTARTLKTAADGTFTANVIPIGSYTVRVNAKGFKELVRSGIELHTDDNLTLQLVLPIGDMSQTVTVDADAPQVELQSPTAGGLVSGNEVRELALNNRNYLQLLSLMPGVTATSATDELYIGTTNPLGGTNTIPFSVNGGRNSASNYMVDGADNVDRGSNQTLLNTPSVDSIAEVKVVRAQYSAEYGRGATGMINVVSKGGTLRWHGGAYEFDRNDAFAANNFFNNARAIKRPPLRYNNFGWTFSGPIPFRGYKRRERNKTFFFVSQEYRRVITYGTFQALVPTEAMKSGTFNQPVCVAVSGTTCTATATQITAINPLAKAYIQDIWSKIPEGDASLNLFTPLRSNYNGRQELIKGDHYFNQNHQISVRYLQDAIPTVEPGGLFTGAALPGVSTTSTNSPGRNWTVRATSNFKRTLINEAGYSHSYGAITSDPIGLDNSKLSPDIKVALPFPSTLNRIPALSISGFSSITGYGPYRDFNFNNNLYDNVTKMLGKHTLKAGVSVNLYRKTENAAGNNVGAFTIPSTPRPTGTSVANQGWANFLLGQVSTFTQASLDLTPDIRQNQAEAYVQDDYRIHPRLTLNSGLRYSNFRSPYDANHQLTNFNPALWSAANAPQINPANGNIVPGTGDRLNGIVINGKSQFGDKVTNDSRGVWAPRAGFAWSPFKNGKTAVRAGYGMSFDSTLVGTYEQSIFANPPFVNSVNISNTLLDNPLAGVTVISAAPLTIHGTPIPNKLPYTQQWSFDVQRQIGKFVADVGYYGAKSTHLLGIVDLNEVPAGAAVAAGITKTTVPITSTTTPLLNAIRPYRGYGPINVLENWFNSNYNSLQSSLMARLPKGNTARVSYTFSKTLTNSTSDRSNAPQNTYNLRAEYARANFDRTHVLTASYIYTVPFKNVFLKGWEMSGIATFNAGLPLRVTSGLGFDWGGLGILGTSAVSPRPDRISDPNAAAPRTIAKWFNTTAFAAVPTGDVRPGNAAATTVIGPGFQVWTISLFRNFKIRERLTTQVRFETFNTFNHTNFQGVSTSLGATNFGQVTSARDPRRIQLGAKCNF